MFFDKQTIPEGHEKNNVTHQRSCEVVIMHVVLVNDSDAFEMSNTKNVTNGPSIGFMKITISTKLVFLGIFPFYHSDL